VTRTGAGAGIAFASVTTLFFAWGFISSNNDPLIVSLRAIFSLSYTEALATQLVFFLGYGLMSLPAASISNRIGPVRTILLALAVMIAGCLLVLPSATFDAYPPILAALFVLAIGITTLQVAANPLAAALGPPERSHFRLTLAQAFNSLGVVIGVHYGSRIMLGDRLLAQSHGPITGPLERAEALGAVTHAFLIIAALLAALLLFIWLQRGRITGAVAGMAAFSEASVLDAVRSRWALFGAVAIALYVGAEVSIGSIMINFLNQPDILGLPLAEGGAHLANFYWGGALLGRFLGSWLLTRVAAARLLAFAAISAVFLCGIVASASGPVAGYAALAIGLFNSIMFPTIFTLTLERSDVSQSSTSGLLCLAIAGGAALPILVGLVADELSLGQAFGVPLVAYGVIALFAWRAKGRLAGPRAVPAAVRSGQL
jgi:FHS family L-fucose permease-like MFS transporter